VTKGKTDCFDIWEFTNSLMPTVVVVWVAYDGVSAKAFHFSRQFYGTAADTRAIA